MFSFSRCILLLFIQCLLSSNANAARNNCKEGTFFDGNSCKLCPPGTYQDEKKATKCKKCPPGTYNPVSGIVGIDLCRPCPRGTFSKSTAATSSTVCKPCPKGESAEFGSNSCKSCPPGKRISTDDPLLLGNRTPICTDCFYDQVSDTPTDLFCRSCPVGTITKNNGCKVCPPGRGANRIGTPPTRCLLCRFGEYSDGTFECKGCPPGSQPNRKIGGDACIPCPPGTASRQTRRSGHTCKPCRIGENKNAIGATFCLPVDTPCPSHYFLDSTGACQTCNKGQRFVESTKKCVPCGEEEGSDGGLSKKCSRCPPNKIRSARGCVCRPGFETLFNGTCSMCPPNTYYYEPNGECISCPSNHFNKGGVVVENCTPCPAGQILKEDKSGCEDCPEGTRYNDVLRGDRCVELRTNCPPGQERVLGSDGVFSRCQPKSCPPGSFELRKKFSFLKTRLRECVVCERGEFLVGRNYFNPCKVCKFTEVSDGGTARECKPCPKGEVGFFFPGFGAKCACVGGDRLSRGFIDGECKVCPRGTYGEYGVEGCTPCPAGYFYDYFGDGAQGFEDTCSKCPKGEFTSDPGSTSCTKCPPGTVSFGVGDTSCVVVGSLK